MHCFYDSILTFFFINQLLRSGSIFQLSELFVNNRLIQPLGCDVIINKLSNYPINATSFFDLLEPREIVNVVLFFFT